MGARVVLAAVLLALGAPGVASAATVRVDVENCSRYGYCDSYVRFVAPPGELNDVTIRDELASTVVTDSAAPLAPGPGCRAVTAHEVACEHGWPDVMLGDGDDRVRIASDSIVYVDAGPGADVVVTGEGLNTIVAGPGSDVVLGGPGTDHIRDGVRVAYEADVYDGGLGVDSVSWEGRRRRVVASLAAPDAAGSAGEGDRLVTVESLVGGERGDVLRGDAGRNHLFGGDGADVLAGGGEVDALAGGPGDDVLRGGDGVDWLESPDTTGFRGYVDSRGSDVVRCGAAFDRVEHVTAADVVADDCERVARTFDLLTQASLTDPILRLLPYWCFEGKCRVQVTARARGRLLGHRRFFVRRELGYSGRVALHLSREGRRLLRRARRLHTTITLCDGAYCTAWTVLFRAPP
jgi:RTX calcium-binding nonapeptide repeat (4 copies)